MAASNKTYKRRQYFIKGGFQYQFIVKFCLLVLLGAFISTVLLFLFSQNTLTSSFENSKLVVKTTALSILPVVLYTNLITLFLITLATIGVTLFVSHKIAGPMFRLEAGMQAIQSGDLTQRISFRKKDQVEVMAENFNKMALELHTQMKIFRSDLQDLQEVAKQENSSQNMQAQIENLTNQFENKFKL